MKIGHGFQRWSAIAPLAGWTLLGAAVRLWNLAGKPPSSIEVASIGFGLGQSFAALPLDRLATVADLLAPLRADRTLGLAQTLERLARESTHPPLFFGLMHGWLQWLTPPGDLVDLGTARLLSVIFGLLAIPLGFWVARWLAQTLVTTADRPIAAVQADRQWLAHGAAAVLALSPYGVAIAQEARHYTLAVLWAIGTWAATWVAAQRLSQGRSPGGWLGLGWVLGNGLALATHYFSILGIAAQGVAIAGLAIGQGRSAGWGTLWTRPWRQMLWIGLGQAAIVAAWLPAITGTSDSELTAWIRGDLSPTEWLMPPVRLLAWLVTMLLLLPVEQQPVVVVLVSAIALLALVILAVRTIGPAWLAGLRRLDSGWVPWWVLTVGTIGPLVLMGLLIYSGKGDLSVAPRYQFVHFPLVAIGMGLALGQVAAGRWPITFGRWHWPGRSVVVILLVASLGGGFLVAENWGFQKSRQTDRLWDWINARSPGPTLLVTEIETAAEVRSTVAIAYEWQRRRDRSAADSAAPPPQFLMLRHESDRADTKAPLAQALNQGPRPFDLWLVDLSPELDLALVGCPRIPEARSHTGYRLRHHRCTGPTDKAAP